MKIKILLFLFITISNSIYGQSASGSLSSEAIEAYEQKVRQLVSFLEFSLNTIGNEKTPTREKDIIINESYSKAFKHDKVQIEDDLDENRDVITNKDVQAYLKDVDYFFKDVEFKFDIEDIDHYINDDGQFFFKVTLNRNLKGITLDNDSVNTNKTRYIEINLDELEKDLKIASIYTNKLSEKEELSAWWNDLSFEWRSIFKKEIGEEDSVAFTGIKKIVNIEKLDISNNQYVVALDPLMRLTRLKELNISNTEIASLIPLRNLTKLEVIKFSGAPIASMEPLNYSLNLKEIICDNTFINRLDPIQNFRKLEKLHIHNTSVYSLSQIENLTKLKDLKVSDTHIRNLNSLAELKNLVLLDFSNTRIEDLTPLAGLLSLEQLNMDNTLVSDLKPLNTLKNLRVLYCNNTLVSRLDPLGGIPSLEKVYCDNTPISKSKANLFMQGNENVLVISESGDLKTWWDKLSTDWRKVFMQYVPAGNNPSKEELAKMANQTVVDISGNPYIRNLEPLHRLRHLQELVINDTKINDLTPLKDQVYLQTLKLANTQVSDLAPLENLSNLKMLNIDNTPVDPEQVNKFINENPDVLVIYRTSELRSWWEELSADWQQVLRSNFTMAENPADEQLHEVVRLDSLSIINNFAINDLSPLKELKGLKKLYISNTGVKSLSPVRFLKKLEVLVCSKNPIRDLEPLKSVSGLRTLNFEDTPVEELDPLENLMDLEVLKCSGTQVDDLKPISRLFNLKHLDCFNTDIKNLKALKNLNNLKILRCYNTRVSEKDVESFKAWQPQCEVIFY